MQQSKDQYHETDFAIGLSIAFSPILILGAFSILMALVAELLGWHGHEMLMIAAWGGLVTNSMALALLALHFVERKEDSKALHDSQNRYQALFRQAMDGILLLDMQGNIVSVNDSFARMHGYSADELRKMSLRQLDTPETLAQAPRRFARIQAGESIGFEVRHFHKEGHIVPLEVSASAIDLDGESFVLAFHRDITERLYAEEEVRRSHEELRVLAAAAQSLREQEKSRVARELHDELAQALTALQMDVTWLTERLPVDQHALTGKLDDMRTILDDTVTATRRIAADLRPLILDDLGLVPAAEWLVQNFTEHNGVECRLTIDAPDLDPPEPQASALFRILQESLTNIARHAHASLVTVSLDQSDGEIRLSIHDNGRGFSPTDPRKPNSYGLMGLRERASLAGGEARIDSGLDRGTLIEVRVPVARAEAGHEDFSV